MPQPTEAAKEAIIPHLQYEWDMLHQSGELLAMYREIRHQLPVGAWSAWLESFVVHTRNLIEFLSYSPSGDGARATHFNPDWKADLPRVLGAVRAKSNEQVSHVSYARTWLSPQDFDWPIQQIREELDALMTSLIESAPDGPLAKLRKPCLPPSIRQDPHLVSLPPITASSTGPRGMLGEFQARTTPDDKQKKYEPKFLRPD